MAFRYNNYGLIVSIDFGTTFSGTCYAITGKMTPKELRNAKYPSIIHVTDWPKQTNLQHKTPSINIYDRNFHLIHWGRSALDVINSGKLGTGYQVIDKFKLALPSSIAQKGAIHQTGNTSQKELLNMRATIDYFREIFDHTVSTMQNQILSDMNSKDSIIEKENIRFVITVPAQWNDVQRAIMRNVAKEAGLISEDDHENRLLIINESLAATLYCERKKSKRINDTVINIADDTNITNDTEAGSTLGLLSKNDRYMICDAGGGTVDLAVFESTENGNDNNNDSFRRCQLTADSGEKCGSVFLDENMKNLLLEICFSVDIESLNKDKKEKKRLESLISPLVDHFIDIKTTFGIRSEEFKPYCEEKHIEEQKKEIKKTINEQIAKKNEIKKREKELKKKLRRKNQSDYDDSADECTDEPIDESIKESIEESITALTEELEKLNENKVCRNCDLRNNSNDANNVMDPKFGGDTIFTINQGKFLKELKLKYNLDGVKVKLENEICQIKISYKVMRERVFDDVIKSTLDLLRRQIKKSNGSIKRTYLVGGFGGSPYLRKRILKEFHEDSECYVGDLIQDDRGNTAAMRGALIYGIDGSRKEPQSDVVEHEYKSTDTEKFNTLICLDIGYNGTACSYRDLESQNEEMTEIINWPGLKGDNFIIPTAKETTEGGQTLWGAEVVQTTNLDPELLIVPSELMSIVKSDFRAYLSDYIKLVFGHIHGVISKNNSKLSDKSKYRYVITMENCYPFFNNKKEMRDIAQLAGIIDENDSPKRLLLIRRDNAAAMFFEKNSFTEKKAYSNHFLQISVYHDTCYLSLNESTKISGFDKSVDTRTSESTETAVSRFRNVRSMRSATFVFNFVAKLVANLDSFVSTSACINCTDPSSHETYSPTYYSELRDGFLDYMKNTLDFNNNDKTQTIVITKTKCCEISITIYDLLEHVFRPATRDLASEINRFATQVDMSRLFNFDKIFLSGVLVEAKKDAYAFLEKILLKNISEVMNIQSDLITPSEMNGKEALLGAAHYGNNPEDFTERVSRRSYIVKVSAFKCKEFTEDVMKNVAEIEKKKERRMKHDVYNEEARNALIDEKRPVDLYYQSSRNPSLKNETHNRTPEDGTFLIYRGDKISEHNQMYGISKRFYAEEECIVYATIYYSEDSDLKKVDSDLKKDDSDVKNDSKIDFTNFKKIHRFEIYVKKDKDDPMTEARDARLHFDVRIIPDNNEAKFEANVCSRLGSKIPEFRFRDEILVANIYGDEEHIKVTDLTIKTDDLENPKVGDSAK